MNRRTFLKNASASGMVLMAPLSLSLSSTASAATDLSPVGQYFVFAHLGGGWEPTTFCNPHGNKLRSTVGVELGKQASQVRNAGSPVNRFPASAIRRAQDIYAGTSSIDAELKYAPYLGTFNQAGAAGELDDDSANQGLTSVHIQQILSGELVADLLTAAPSAGFSWQGTKTVAQISVNARAIIEGTVTTIELGAIATDELVDRNLALNGTQMAANLFVYDAFVCLHADQLRVLNRTNSHQLARYRHHVCRYRQHECRLSRLQRALCSGAGCRPASGLDDRWPGQRRTGRAGGPLCRGRCQFLWHLGQSDQRYGRALRQRARYCPDQTQPTPGQPGKSPAAVPVPQPTLFGAGSRP